MSAPKRLAIIFISFFAFLQIIRFEKTNPQTDPSLEIKADRQVMSILKASCYDCHSNNTVWPWYSNIAPASWIVISDVNNARKWLNFSEWEQYDEARKTKLKKLIYREIITAMPMHLYLAAHEDAKMSEQQKRIIQEWTGIKSGSVTMRD